MERQDQHVLYMLNVTKWYGEKEVLADVDFAVTEGEFVTLVGPSGCGKSTLLRLVLAQELPTSGELLVGGAPVSTPSPDRGIVYQKYSLYPHLTVLGNVMAGLQLSKSLVGSILARKQIKDEATEYLRHVRLAEHAHKYPHELSGGMRQRIAIAQALVMKPKILMMDEPFGALDPFTREEMQTLILHIWQEYGMTIFFVTHDLEEAVYLGSRVVCLSQFYDDRVTPAHGARIVCDLDLGRELKSTEIKTRAEFGETIQAIRHEGFDAAHRQEIESFNLKHPDSFMTTAEPKGRR